MSSSIITTKIRKNNKCSLYMEFNQDSSCFCIGNKKGYIIYKSYPLMDYCKRILNESISLISMLYKTNIIAFVGESNNLNYHPNELIIWDDFQWKMITKITVNYNIKNVKLSMSYIFIIGESEINVFSFESFKHIEKLNTYNNKNGIMSLSSNNNCNIISYPSTKLGEIIIKNYNDKINGTIKINAHQSEVAAIGINSDGSLVASASEKGTIIRIFLVKNGMLIQELRRGTEPVDIYTLVFDSKSQYLACSSSKGTIHIFNIKKNNSTDNQKSILGSITSYLGIQSEYLNSEWSFAQFHLSHKGKNIVTFYPGYNQYLIVITSDGNYYLLLYNQKEGGECSITLKQNFLLFSNDDEEEFS